MFQVPRSQLWPSVDDTETVSLWRWLTASPAERHEWRRRRRVAADQLRDELLERFHDDNITMQSGGVQPAPPPPVQQLQMERLARLTVAAAVSKVDEWPDAPFERVDDPSLPPGSSRLVSPRGPECAGGCTHTHEMVIDLTDTGGVG
jgi:hypothetical protein